MYLYRGLGIGDGDWGLGIGDWGWAQSPIPDPQSPKNYNLTSLGPFTLIINILFFLKFKINFINR